MGLSWQQGPLGRNPNGQFLVPDMPARVLYAEPLRRRMRIELGGQTVVQSDDAVLLFEPGRHPVAYFADAVLTPTVRRSEQADRVRRRRSACSVRRSVDVSTPAAKSSSGKY